MKTNLQDLPKDLTIAFVRKQLSLVQFVVVFLLRFVHGFPELNKHESMVMETSCDPHHSKKLMTFIQVCHDNALTFGNVPIGAHKHAVFPQGSDLIERKLILRSKRSSCVH